MFETTGALAIIQPVLPLVALVVVPLLWALVAAASVKSNRTASSALIATIFVMTCAVGTLGLTVVLAIRLMLLPRGYLLVQHVSQLARLGQLDLSFDLTFGPRSATFAAVIAVIACASTLHEAWSSRPNTNTTLAWTGLATAGAMLLCIADGFAPILVGLGVLSLGVWGLSSGGDATPNTVALAGNASVLVGLVFLFWALGGTFGPEGYDPDGAPRFVAVTTPSRGEQATKATLSMTTHAGALVSSDDAHLPGEPLASPFSILVDPGVYTVRVQGGAASADIVVPRVALAAGRTHVLTPYGPTASLRVLDDQIAVPRLGPAGERISVPAVLAGRTIAGLRASAIVLLLVLGGALAHAQALASRRGLSGLAVVFESLPAPYLALRFAPLIVPSSFDGALVAVLGAVSALVIAAKAATVEDGHRVLRGTLAASASVSLVAVGLGESSAALVLACSAPIATAAAVAALEARRDVRWLGVACASGVGLFPFAGASPGYILALTKALGATTGRPAWAVFAVLVVVALVGAVTLTSLAAFRVYDALSRASVHEPGGSRGQGAVVIVLAATALAVGAVLGTGTTTFGGTVVPIAHRLIPPDARPVPRVMAALAVVLSLVSAAGGATLARRVSAESVAPSWLLSLGRPYAALGSAAQIVGRAARFLHRSVRAMDRDVVDDVPIAIRDLALRAAGLLMRMGRHVDEPLDHAAGAVAAKLDIEDPSTAERWRTIILLLMVALLGVVVLSSFILH